MYRVLDRLAQMVQSLYMTPNSNMSMADSAQARDPSDIKNTTAEHTASANVALPDLQRCIIILAPPSQLQLILYLYFEKKMNVIF